MHIKAFFSVEYLAGLKVCNQGHEDHECCFMKETVTHHFVLSILIAWRYASDDAWSIVPEMLSGTLSKFPIYFNGEKIPPNRESVKKILFSAKWCINQSRTKVSSVHPRHVSHAWPSLWKVKYMGKARHILTSLPCRREKLSICFIKESIETLL